MASDPAATMPETNVDAGWLYDVTHTGTSLAAMASEAQTVIAMRTLGMLGFWPMGLGENTQMIMEKPAAMVQAADEAMRATLQGLRPDQVLGAALEPIRACTQDNAHRLTRLDIWDRN
ncbi:antibiotic ABC transporter [Fluviibacterium sp. S390]|uniref:antibiotic ABC transporter n=2 Tax=unclassified Meridianimarinicoccus TaxID=2923344 RepID=UPI003C7D309C